MTTDRQSVAALIKQARIAKGVSIKDISRDICVSSFYLEAIEAGQYDKLPEKAFAHGFVKAYAKAVGLNDCKVVELFKAELSHQSGEEGPSGQGNQAACKSVKIAPPPKKSLLATWGAGLTGVIGMIATWFVVGAMPTAPTATVTSLASNTPVQQQALVSATSDMQNNIQADPVVVDQVADQSERLVATGQMVAASASTETSSDSAGQESVASESTQTDSSSLYADASSVGDAGTALLEKSDPMAPGQDLASDHLASTPTEETPARAFFPAAYADTEYGFEGKIGKEIVLEALEDSWVRLANSDGVEIWSGVLRQGDLYRPAVPETIVLTTSNAGGVQVNLGSVEGGPLGNRGEILTDYTIKLPM
ncbi:hypothetical protein GCM10017044_00180 [Kordiimonas sediminis]|uniref:Cytoskeleton protein RodZ-like C-terminal domain-containing protein n=1 Tax=Kordiimonas sediminis TaxID=1735581 RepID=A0A919AIL0_9PROT|nr:helix-turn-helix domain-containing protein [Kordiimonas sediminis]GHF10459.1 hypothetical protein GCM10017044_00180 [Kordiimonas sediminis]